MATDTRSELQDFQSFISRQLDNAGPAPSPEACLQLWRERFEVLEAVEEGMADAAAGRTQSLEEFLEELHSWTNADAR
jgi:predicted transcriptional regulator